MNNLTKLIEAVDRALLLATLKAYQWEKDQ